MSDTAQDWRSIALSAGLRCQGEQLAILCAIVAAQGDRIAAQAEVIGRLEDAVTRERSRVDQGLMMLRRSVEAFEQLILGLVAGVVPPEDEPGNERRN